MKRQGNSPPSSLELRFAKAARADEVSLVAYYVAILPPEMLEILFSYTPYYPRLRVISLVCRRWRRAVLNSIDRLHTKFQDTRIGQAVSLFPNLTSLVVRSIKGEFVVPSRLRSLHVAAHRCTPQGCGTRPFIGCTSITELSLGVTHCFHREDLLQSLQSTLAHLALDDVGYVPPREFPFPELRSLSMQVSTVETSDLNLISRLASQLTRLACRRLPASTVFPRMRQLHFHYRLARNVPLPRCQLAIELHSIDLLSRDIIPVASLTDLSVSVPASSYSADLIPLLTPYTSITNLTLTNTHHASTAANTLSSLPYCNKLRSVALIGPPDSTGSLPPLKSLAVLCTNYSLTPDPEMSHLTRLELIGKDIPMTTLIATAQAFIAQTRSLRFIRLDCAGSTARHGCLPNLISFLKRCEAGEVDEVVLHDVWLSRAKDLAWCRWLLVTCIPLPNTYVIAPPIPQHQPPPYPADDWAHLHRDQL